MPQHHIVKGAIYVIACTILVALAFLFARGVSDSPYPTPTPDYSNVQLRTL